MEEARGLYIISVAARLLEMHPQTLRKYERAGFLTPSRTVGMLRLYSEEDILRLHLIKHLVEDLGLNLAGVELCLKLAEVLMQAHQQLDGASPREGRQQAAQQAVQRALELLGIVPRQAPAPRQRVSIEIEGQER